MLQVLSLGLADHPGVGWSERILRDISLSLNWMSHRIHEGVLPVWKLNDDGVPMIGDQHGILAVDYS